MAPTTLKGVKKYLGSGMIGGIGPVYARKLVRAFGGAVFDLIEHQPDSLREVGPIGASAVPVRPSHLATVFRVQPIGLLCHLPRLCDV